MNYILHIAIMLEIYIILALSLNLLVGFTGLLSIGHAALYGIGAYATAILMVNFDFNFFLALPLAVVVNIFFSGLLTVFAWRLRDLYFALSTLAFQVIIYALFYNWISVTNGPYGIAGISRPILLGMEFNSLTSFFVLAGGFTLLTILFFLWFNQTPFSRMFQSIRDDQLAVVTLGKSPNYFKFISIALSSVFATISGALYATYVSYIDATSFNLDESILIISIILIGGMGNVRGPVLGATFYLLLPELLRFVNLPDAQAANLRMIIFALVLILVVRFRPRGFAGKYAIE